MTEVMEGELDVYFTFELVPVSGMNILKTISYSLYKAQKADNSWLDVNTRYQYVVKRGEFGQTYGTSLKLSLVIKLMPVEIYGSTTATATTASAASAASAAAVNSPRSGNSINTLYNNADQSDVEIQCGCLVVKAHKSILSAQSETLKTALSSPVLKEGKTGVYTISESHMDIRILRDVLRYMYQYPIDGAAEKVADLLEAADYFQIASLKAFCAQILVRRLRLDNWLKTLDLAYKYDSKPLMKACNDLLISDGKRIKLAEKNILPETIRNIPQAVRDFLGLRENSARRQ